MERYSGYDCTATYPPDELKTGRPVVAFSAPTVDHDSNAWPDFWWVLVKNTVTLKPPAQFESFYERFCIRHALRTLRKRNQLYSEVGFPKALSDYPPLLLNSEVTHT